MIKRMLALAGAFLIAGLGVTVGQTPQGPKPKSKGEQDALVKVQQAAQANDPKATLAAISQVLENFTDTEYKPMLLDMAVQAAQQTGDLAETVVWGERAIQSDPNDIQARVILAETIAANTHQNDLDKDKSIQKITDNANKALELLPKAETPQGGFPADKWPQVKAHMTAQAHDALGQAAAVDKKYPEAIKEYQTGLEADPADPLILARLTKAYNDAKQYDQAITTADKILAMKDCPQADNSACAAPQVKNYVTAQKNFATKLKGSATPAAPTTAPQTPPAAK